MYCRVYLQRDNETKGKYQVALLLEVVVHALAVWGTGYSLIKSGNRKPLRRCDKTSTVEENNFFEINLFSVSSKKGANFPLKPKCKVLVWCLSYKCHLLSKIFVSEDRFDNKFVSQVSASQDRYDGCLLTDGWFENWLFAWKDDKKWDGLGWSMSSILFWIKWDMFFQVTCLGSIKIYSVLIRIFLSLE